MSAVCYFFISICSYVVNKGGCAKCDSGWQLYYLFKPRRFTKFYIFFRFRWDFICMFYSVSYYSLLLMCLFYTRQYSSFLVYSIFCLKYLVCLSYLTICLETSIGLTVFGFVFGIRSSVKIFSILYKMQFLWIKQISLRNTLQILSSYFNHV